MTEHQSPNADDRSRLSLENVRLAGEVSTLRSFIEALDEVMGAIESPQPDAQVIELLNEILGITMKLTHAQDGSLLARDEDTEELVFILVRGEISSEELLWRRIPRGQGIASWVVENRRTTIVNNVQMDDRFDGQLDQELDFHTQAVLAAPIIGRGKVLGVIELLNKENSKLFSLPDQTHLGLVCRFAGELLESLLQHQNIGVEDTLTLTLSHTLSIIRKP